MVEKEKKKLDPNSPEAIRERIIKKAEKDGIDMSLLTINEKVKIELDLIKKKAWENDQKARKKDQISAHKKLLNAAEKNYLSNLKDALSEAKLAFAKSVLSLSKTQNLNKYEQMRIRVETINLLQKLIEKESKK